MIGTIDPIRDVRRRAGTQAATPAATGAGTAGPAAAGSPTTARSAPAARFPLHNPILRRPRPQDEGAGRRVGMHTAFAVRTVLGRRSTCFLTCVSGCPPDARSPGQARRTLEGLRVSLDDPVVDNAALLVSEVVSNSVRHAGLGAADAIEVRIRGSRGGTPRRRDRSRARVRAAGQPREDDGGWGLWLLDQLATRWGSSTLTARVVRPGSAGSAASASGVPELRGSIRQRTWRWTAGENMDKAGVAKEAVGDLTDNERLGVKGSSIRRAAT